MNLLGLAFADRPQAKIRPSLELDITYFRLEWNTALVTFSLWPWRALRTNGSFCELTI